MYEIDLSTAKTVYVTAGPYKGQWISMDPGDADAAISGNWAVETLPGLGGQVTDEDLAEFQSREIDQESMDAWLEKVNEPPPPPAEPK